MTVRGSFCRRQNWEGSGSVIITSDSKDCLMNFILVPVLISVSLIFTPMVPITAGTDSSGMKNLTNSAILTLGVNMKFYKECFQKSFVVFILYRLYRSQVLSLPWLYFTRKSA